MRIVFVNSMRAMGGGETWLLETAAGMRDRGHDIAVVTRAGSALSARAAAEGHAVVTLPMRSDFDPESVLRLAGLIRTTRPHVLCVNIQRAVRIGCAATLMAGGAAVVERRGLNFAVRPTSLNRWIYGRRVSVLIANCREIADEMTASGLVSRDRVAVVPNGIDPVRVPPGGGEAVRSELGIGPDAPLIAIVARLVPDKGHADAIEAFASVLRGIPAARLVIVGEGKLRRRLEDMASERLPAGSAVFTGFRPDVPAVLDAADVLLVTSYREGSPHSVLEAMVAGTPVVATSVAGIPEIIEDGRSGWLVAPGKPGEAATALLRALGDPVAAASVATAAGKRVRERFGLSRMMEDTERCFMAAHERRSVGTTPSGAELPARGGGVADGGRKEPT